MRLLLLLVAIYSLIIYQHYKITKSKTLLQGAKMISGTEASHQFSVSQQPENRGSADFFTTDHSPGYKNNQWKPQMASFSRSSR
jgi:hypothetical protein